MDKILVVHVEKCLACRSCEIECAVAHSASKDLFVAVSERPVPRSRVSVEGVSGLAMPLQCRHCEDAPCITICPTKAIIRADANQPISLESEKCIGCKWCILVCPFGVITLDADSRVAVKCDLCVERLSRGELPACVAACPSGALEFKSVTEVVSEKRKASAQKFLTEIGR